MWCLQLTLRLCLLCTRLPLQGKELLSSSIPVTSFHHLENPNCIILYILHDKSIYLSLHFSPFKQCRSGEPAMNSLKGTIEGSAPSTLYPEVLKKLKTEEVGAGVHQAVPGACTTIQCGHG